MEHSNQLPLSSTYDYYQPQPIPTPSSKLQLESDHTSFTTSCMPSITSRDADSDTDSEGEAHEPLPRQDRFINLCRTLERQETELSHVIGEVYGDSAKAEYDNYLEDPEDFVYGLGLSATLESVATAALRQLEAEEETEAQDTDHSFNFERIRALLEFSKRWRHGTKHCENTMAHNVEAIEGLLSDI